MPTYLAHICGAAGKRTRRGILNTIVGLDPAGPLFDVSNPFSRLAVSDAQYVEVIHTDTQSLGIGFPIGNADFFPNGGSGMPGCLSRFGIYSDQNVFLKSMIIFTAAICDHGAAVNYFVETLNSDRLWGRRCTNLAEMDGNRCTGVGASMGGDPSNFRLNLNGIFRMPTNANSPFGVGQF